MINSNDRKLTLSGWLKNKSFNDFSTPLKLQKFLFFYEAFSKVKNNDVDFSYLMGYKNGPVFSNVYGDYRHENILFNQKIDVAFVEKLYIIDEKIANKVAFLVKILTSNELSDLTHKMNIWKSKENEINAGVKNVILNEEDFNGSDVNFIKTLDSMYTDDDIFNYKILDVGKNHFLVKKEDYGKINEEHIDTMYVLSRNEKLMNPVYVEIDNNGGLLID